MKIRIEHRNRLDCAIDDRLIWADDEKTLQAKIKAALIVMIEDNVIDPGDRFVIIEI